jgi:hypothetical protein
VAAYITDYNRDDNFYTFLNKHNQEVERQRQLERDRGNRFEEDMFRQEYQCDPIGDDISNPYVHRVYRLERELEYYKNEHKEMRHKLAGAIEQRNMAERLAKEAVEENIELKKRIEQMNKFEKFDIMEMDE